MSTRLYATVHTHPWSTFHAHRSAQVAVSSRGQHTCTTAGQCLAEATQEGGAKTRTATEGQNSHIPEDEVGGSLSVVVSNVARHAPYMVVSHP